MVLYANVIGLGGHTCEMGTCNQVDTEPPENEARRLSGMPCVYDRYEIVHQSHA